jgi:hypothetical protein
MKLLGLVVLYIAVALFGAAALAKLPHVLYGKRIAGQVVDADTGQPIAGAHVAFVWESGIIPSGFTGHNSRDICYHAAAAVTDQAGHFQVAPWRKWSTYSVNPEEPIALVYARNYTPRQIPIHVGYYVPPIERTNERFALKVFKGNTDQRMDALFWGLSNKDCAYGGQSQKSLYALLKAILDESRQIARTKDNQDTVDTIARMAAKAALAADPNGRVTEAQVNEFIREHLQ